MGWVLALTFLVAVALLPGPVAAYQFEDATLLDHRNLWGLRLDVGSTFLAAATLGGTGSGAAAGSLEVGISRGLPHTGHELSVRARPLIRPGSAGLLLLGGYRVLAGLEHWKTYADLDLVLPVLPGPAAGARLGFGAMYDFHRGFGISLSGGAFAAMGRALVSGFDVSLGAQVRFE